MIPPQARIALAAEPVDFRKGIDGLAALVRDAGSDPFSGSLFVFRAKRADRIKILWWDGTGLCLLAKRLEQDQFHWPRLTAGVIRLSSAQLMALIEGMDWRRVRVPEATRPTSVG
ncbi:MAG: transposase [Methylocystaceae bacterium]|jgi:transposase|nr:transposase [Methylocystaceae bacterium]